MCGGGEGCWVWRTPERGGRGGRCGHVGDGRRDGKEVRPRRHSAVGPWGTIGRKIRRVVLEAWMGSPHTGPFRDVEGSGDDGVTRSLASDGSPGPTGVRGPKRDVKKLKANALKRGLGGLDRITFFGVLSEVS